MKHTLSLALTTALLVGLSLAQNSPRFAPGTELRVELDKTIDAKKAKAGELVVAKTLDEIREGNQVVAPRGSKVIGHIVAATPHEKGSPSTLEIAFDKFDLGNASQVPIKATIQALAKPANNPSPEPSSIGQLGGGNPAMGGGNRMGGMQPGGSMGQPPGSPNVGNTGTMGGTPAPSPSTEISANARGVAGISGVSLSLGPTQDSVLTSEKHNVKLDSGTQMVLRVE
jgi:hypothetical protein